MFADFKITLKILLYPILKVIHSSTHFCKLNLKLVNKRLCSNISLQQNTYEICRFDSEINTDRLLEDDKMIILQIRKRLISFSLDSKHTWSKTVIYWFKKFHFMPKNGIVHLCPWVLRLLYGATALWKVEIYSQRRAIGIFFWRKIRDIGVCRRLISISWLTCKYLREILTVLCEKFF